MSIRVEVKGNIERAIKLLKKKMQKGLQTGGERCLRNYMLGIYLMK